MKRLQKIWNDPVGSKVIAGIILAILSLIYVTIKSLLQDISWTDSFVALMDMDVKLKYILIAATFIFALIIIRLLIKKSKGIRLDYNQEHRELDKELLKKIKNELTSDGTISFMRDNHFGSSFLGERLEELENFSFNFGKPEFEFIDAELNHHLENLKRNTAIFRTLIAANTWTNDNPNVEVRSIPKEWQYERKDHYNKIIKEIHESAEEICKSYDELIKLGKRKLGV